MKKRWERGTRVSPVDNLLLAVNGTSRIDGPIRPAEASMEADVGQTGKVDGSVLARL